MTHYSGILRWLSRNFLTTSTTNQVWGYSKDTIPNTLYKTHYTKHTIPNTLYLMHEKSADCDPLIIPYKVIILRFVPFYDITTESPSADFSYARYPRLKHCSDRLQLYFIYHIVKYVRDRSELSLYVCRETLLSTTSTRGPPPPYTIIMCTWSKHHSQWYIDNSQQSNFICSQH